MPTPSQPSKLYGVHPLHFIPFIQRWSRTPLRRMILTSLWSMSIGTAIWVAQLFGSGHISFRDYFVPMLVISNTIGFVTHGGLVGLNVLLRDWPLRQTGLRRSLYYVVTLAVLSIIGLVLGNAIVHGRNPLRLVEEVSDKGAVLLFVLAMSFGMLILTTIARRRAQAEVLMLRQREDMAATAQLLAEARLRALQAQIEPHFLFNTLANVLGLMDSQPAQARHMLERFIDFLRASLHASRADHATVGAELNLTAAYLDVLAVRMGKRLQYRIEADDAVRTATIAPMLIQPLVENAVMHGLESSITGGTVTVRVHRDAAGLIIEVLDDGVGIGNAPPRTGGGVGMANVKARALAMHGTAAQLQLLDNPGGGAIVRLVLPLPNVSKEPSSTSPQP